MSEPSSPARDKNYNLTVMLQESLQKVFQLETYIADAEREGDSELANWFRRMQDNNRTADDQGKVLLQRRLHRENG